MHEHKVLIVDDDEFVCEDIATSLDRQRYEIDTANSEESALEIFRKKNHHIVLTDLKMKNPDDGFILLEKIKSLSPATAVIVLTSYADMQKAIRAMQLGAIDFITKPYEIDHVVARIEGIAERIVLRSENKRLRQVVACHYEMVGQSGAMCELKKQIGSVAKSDSRVLITGPNGSGKELVAWAIHNQSSRLEKPFVTVNCAALPETLIESELFGTTKAAYTGAIDKKGKFETAHEGTIFLDEVGDMSLPTQAKVLRILENGEISRLGSERTSHVNVRVIAATNKNLQEMVAQKSFREDLYYRLNVAAVQTIPLKYRSEDIPLLIDHKLFLLGKSQRAADFLTPKALDYLMTLDWPGNIRELNNVVERLMIYWAGTPYDIDTVKQTMSMGVHRDVIADTARTLKDATDDFERNYIAKVIAECSGNMTEAAKRLDLQRPYLYDKMKKLGVEKQ
jgi:two-component system nitrogen regulation response regulator NtrX